MKQILLQKGENYRQKQLENECLIQKIDRIFSSHMGRAKETAEPACRLLGIEKQIEGWTREIGEERLTPFPDGKRKSITFVQNTYIVKTET